MDIERELKLALARSRPEPGLARRVLDRAASEEMPRHRTGGSLVVRLAAGFLLAAMLGVAGSAWIAHERRLEGERAREDLIIAMSIASEKTNIALREVFPQGDHMTDEGE